MTNVSRRLVLGGIGATLFAAAAEAKNRNVNSVKLGALSNGATADGTQTIAGRHAANRLTAGPLSGAATLTPEQLATGHHVSNKIKVKTNDGSTDTSEQTIHGSGSNDLSLGASTNGAQTSAEQTGQRGRVNNIIKSSRIASKSKLVGLQTTEQGDNKAQIKKIDDAQAEITQKTGYGTNEIVSGPVRNGGSVTYTQQSGLDF